MLNKPNYEELLLIVEELAKMHFLESNYRTAINVGSEKMMVIEMVELEDFIKLKELQAKAHKLIFIF